MEMYSTDWSGKYPSSLETLTPKYLETLPVCPNTGAQYEMVTSVAYNTAGFQDYYFLQCSGHGHSDVGLPPGYPQYDGISSPMER